MGWLTNRRIKRMSDPVDGTLTLTGTSAAPTLGVRAQSFTFVGVVRASGLPATAVQVTGLAAPAGKWPDPGSTLPVTVDRADPQRVVIRWQQIPSNRDIAAVQANNVAFAEQTGIDLEVLGRAISGAGEDPPTPPAPSTPAENP